MSFGKVKTKKMEKKEEKKKASGSPKPVAGIGEYDARQITSWPELVHPDFSGCRIAKHNTMERQSGVCTS